MKKVLFASTALVLSAGIAAAEVTVSGDGRMGLVFKGQTVGVDAATGEVVEEGNAWNFTSRIRIKFTASGETDGGLSFGGSMRVDQEDEDGGSASRGAGGSVFISGAFGKLEMGDVVGAAEAVLFDLPEVGLTDLDTPNSFGSGSNELPFLTGDGADGITANDNPVALYTYTTGALTFAASLSDGKVAQGNVDDNQAYAVGVKYATDMWSVGLGYEVLDPAAAGIDSWNQVTLGGTMTFGDTTLSAYAASLDDDPDTGTTFYGLGVSSVFGAITVNAYANKMDSDAGDQLQYGVGASYDLGGGASLVAGIADDDTENCATSIAPSPTPGVTTCHDSQPIADFGIKMSF